MNKTLKILSTVLIVVGLGYVFLYIFSVNMSGIEVLKKPSYYDRQNFWYVFLAGAFVVLFSILSSFLVWHKNAQPQEEILLNAGFTDKKQIDSWLSGSTLDLQKTAKTMDGSDMEVKNEKTEISGKGCGDSTELLMEESIPEEKTELLMEESTPEEKTELLMEESTPEEKTLLLMEDMVTEEKTEILTKEE